MIAVDFKTAKQSFFDRKKVQNAMDRATARAMSKAGAFVRRAARSSIRRTKKSSAPGQPPRAHARDSFATIKNILFYYDDTQKSCIVGPVKIRSRIGRRYPARQTVPQLLEFGGPVVEVTNGRRRVVMQKPRPFMRPALERESPKFAGFFYNQLDKVM